MRLPRRMVVVAGTLVLLAAGWAGYLWLRDVSVLRAKHVKVSGVSGHEARAIRRALTEAGERMTVLHVRESELEQAVDGFASVRAVSASADFPNTLEVRVEQYQPVAALLTPAGRRIAVSGDGTLLGSAGSESKLATVKVDEIPSSRLLPRGLARTLVTVLAGAPPPMRPLLERAFATRRAIEVPLRNGPTLYFGKPDRVAAKWAAAARVLADAGSGGARFIDLRLPERPAATKSAPGERESAPASSPASAPVTPDAAPATAVQSPTATTAAVPADTQP
jgi:cell division protein FtsQ